MINHLKIVHQVDKNLNPQNKLYFDSSYPSDSDSDCDEEQIQQYSNIKTKKINDCLLNFIIRTNQPISLLENAEFKMLIKNLNRKARVPSRNYFTKKLIPHKVR